MSRRAQLKKQHFCRKSNGSALAVPLLHRFGLDDSVYHVKLTPNPTRVRLVCVEVSSAASRLTSGLRL